MLGNTHHPNCDGIRRNEAPNVLRGKNGSFFPPKDCEGLEINGPVFSHEAKLVIAEPGIKFKCPDCGRDIDKTCDGFDHFKYNCGLWQSRLRLQKTFAALKSRNMMGTVQEHHLNNDSINAMIRQGVTLERVAKQPKDWLPNEPLYDHDPITGIWQSTGIVPLDVWANLPQEMRPEPLPQDNSFEARRDALGDPGRRDSVQMNAPRRLEEKGGLHDIECFYGGQCDVRDNCLPGHQGLMTECDEFKLQNERLTSQIGSAKNLINLAVTSGNLHPFVATLITNSFDPTGHPRFIPASVTAMPPALPVPAAPDSVAKQTSLNDIQYLQQM